MSELVLDQKVHVVSSGDRPLQLAANFWFITAVFGQWLFASYLMLFYGGTAARGELHLWKEKLTHGYVPGDSVGNTAVAAHLLLAVIIMLLGSLQLIPQIRTRLPVFHRWSGRLYLLAVVATSIAGLYMLFVHGTVGGLVLQVAQSLDALLILVFAGIALRAAMQRDFKAHRRWALRLFMVVSAVWFFRVGLMLWLVIHQAPVGFDPNTFTGPFVTFIAFAQYVIPLLVLECYFRAQDSASARAKIALSAVLVILTLAMAMGIFGAWMGLWLPNLK
ncbi:DUF2306 domain-containing protein [Cellvibrio sp. KY-GH-1]|uniref:DUF2306 domain-containing protein n=1 Tax=Cellvibrio sp. KY-GH-1 TaxID=2303332 RepID=UPI0012485198|nr:DUF2306 domain-containing protein [Cellvibrio sp. KY-GH-1]QEY16849.1 DUF2306 domain-containing protein [Cellvibrio sp. KY-GH-1]